MVLTSVRQLGQGFHFKSVKVDTPQKYQDITQVEIVKHENVGEKRSMGMTGVKKETIESI